jgi:hypothetical protein
MTSVSWAALDAVTPNTIWPMLRIVPHRRSNRNGAIRLICGRGGGPRSLRVVMKRLMRGRMKLVCTVMDSEDEKNREHHGERGNCFHGEGLTGRRGTLPRPRARAKRLLRVRSEEPTLCKRRKGWGTLNPQRKAAGLADSPCATRVRAIYARGEISSRIARRKGWTEGMTYGVRP